MENKGSSKFQEFHEYVFGDYRYYHYNGLSEDTVTCLDGVERITAEKLVLQAIKKIVMDERAIRAAGYLKLPTAVPVLEKKLDRKSILMRQEIRSSITWALLKIKGNKKHLDKLIDVVISGSGIDGLTGPDAVDLLSDFGKEPSVLNTLLNAFLDDDISMRAAALYSLRKILKDDTEVIELLTFQSFALSATDRKSIVKQIERHIIKRA